MIISLIQTWGASLWPLYPFACTLIRLKNFTRVHLIIEMYDLALYSLIDFAFALSCEVVYGPYLVSRVYFSAVTES